MRVSTGQHLLIIRFSSFGDIVQSIGVPKAFRNKFSNAKVDWLTREDFSELLTRHPEIHHVISFSRKKGFIELIRLAIELSTAHYTHIYDAHNNLRSHILVSVLKFCYLIRHLESAIKKNSDWRSPLFIRRPKNRIKRLLYFKFRLPTLPRHYRGANSFHEPLVPWGLEPIVPSGRQLFVDPSLPHSVENLLSSESKPIVAFAPSAAWAMKRWPVSHWQELVRLLPEFSIFLLGGPEDDFLKEIAAIAPERVRNLAGQLTFNESCAFVARVPLLVANDTGLLHVADQMETPVIGLIGPTAFGYPTHATSLFLETPLYCQPCSKDGRGRCRNNIYQKCLVDILPKKVAKKIKLILLPISPESNS